MSSIPYMPTYVGDVLADVKSFGLTLEQTGAYAVLLWASWKRRTPIEDDPALVAGILGCTRGRWLNKLRPALLPFFELDDEGNPRGGKLIQKRLELELRKAENSTKIPPKNHEKTSKKVQKNLEIFAEKTDSPSRAIARARPKLQNQNQNQEEDFSLTHSHPAPPPAHANEGDPDAPERRAAGSRWGPPIKLVT